MNKLIIIIHPSEIVRKGLTVVLRSSFVSEIMQLEKVQDLQSYRKLKNYSIIVICDHVELNNNGLINDLQEKNTLNFVHLTCLNNKTPSTSLPLEHSITLNSTATEILEIISSCWKSNDKNQKQPENDELTIREKEVLRLVALGYSNKIIADKLFISIHTVISHRKNISEKTGIKSISGLTVYAILNNLIDTKTINPQDLI